MALEFATVHPLTMHPISVDGLVRLGYVSDDKTNYSNNLNDHNTSGRLGYANSNSNKRDWGDQNAPVTATSLRTGLQDVLDKLARVETEVTNVKKSHELTVKESISSKQEARTKSGTTLKAGELDDIAKSVAASNSKEWYVADHLAETTEKVIKLCELVDSLQSAQRKSANANIKVTVPKVLPMSWASVADNLGGW